MSGLFTSLTPPLSTLEPLSWIKPLDYKQPIKNTFASMTLPALTTSEPYIGFKACLHKTNWSSQPPGSILPRQPPLLNSAWWATEAALQPPF